MSAGEAAEDHPGNPDLLNDLAARVRRHGAIPFDIFMDCVLYGPSGYYQTASGVIGRGGDFVTATETSRDFGHTLARQISECLGRLGDVGDLDLVELGAGRGTLASDILEEIEASAPAILPRIHYWIVERSAAMRAEQARVLDAHVRSGRVAWADTIERIRSGGIRGCIIANEFYDALPVKVVLRREGTLHERHVGLSDRGHLIWVDRPVSDPALAAYIARYDLASEEGAIAEAGLEAMIYARRVARALARGFAIVIDYGDRAKALYDPSLRRAGTLVGYHRHRVCENPLALVGEQDLTAHVNFSAIEDAAAEEGLQTHGWTTQGRFLIALGMAERIAELAGSSDPDVLRRRMAMMSLIHPEGMGERFRVLIQGKDVPKIALTGLGDPFAAPGSKATKVAIDPKTTKTTKTTRTTRTTKTNQVGRKQWQAPTS